MTRWRPADLTPNQHRILDSLDRIVWDGISLLESLGLTKPENERIVPQQSVKQQQRKPTNPTGRGKP